MPAFSIQRTSLPQFGKLPNFPLTFRRPKKNENQGSTFVAKLSPTRSDRCEKAPALQLFTNTCWEPFGSDYITTVGTSFFPTRKSCSPTRTALSVLVCESRTTAAVLTLARKTSPPLSWGNRFGGKVHSFLPLLGSVSECRKFQIER